MRELNVNEDISMKVFNEEPENTKLSQQAIFIVDYGSNIGMVLEGGVVPLVKINRKGVYGHGSAIQLSSTKFVDGDNSSGIDAQVDGYMSVLRMTKGDPVSVVVIDNPSQVDIGAAMKTYKDQYLAENSKELTEQRRQVGKQLHDIAFSWRSLSGIRRRLQDSSFTGYYGAGKELMARLADITHPGAPCHYDNLEAKPVK